MDKAKERIEALIKSGDRKPVLVCDLQKFGLESEYDYKSMRLRVAGAEPEVTKIDKDPQAGTKITDITLRPYQVDGVNWLIQRYHHGIGCILGDEMGLGKTCQTIAFLVYLHGTHPGDKLRHLILCPLSVLANWRSELRRFAPNLRLQVYIGDKEKRQELQEEMKSSPFEVLLTTYDMGVKDDSFLRSFSWHTLVVDEAHRLKNRESVLHQNLLQFDISHRVLLTGTPIQNNLTELYTLLCFLAPAVFRWRYLDEFVNRYQSVNDSKEKKELHRLLEPFLLRRIKADVLKDLPNKSEVVVYHGLSSLQKKYYKAILTKDIDAFETNNSNIPSGSKTRLLNILMQLRKCVNHPYLFDGVEPEPFQLGEHLVDSSGKLLLIDQLLTHLKRHGHKVLLFSQMTRMLDIIQDYLGYRGYSYERLDGSVRGEERFLAVKNFNQNDDTFVFLLSTKAGGQGLNLTSADTVVFCDSDFNPQNDLQAAARAHRIGQTRPVKIIRLIGRSTVEEIILRRAEDKLKLTNQVIEGGQFSLGASSLFADNNNQLQDVLKFGIDKIFDEKDDSCVSDIDIGQILGPSVNGQWSKEGQLADNDNQMDVGEDESEAGDLDNMYVFEGEDYSKQPSVADKDAFQRMMEAEKSVAEMDTTGERASRRKKAVLLPMLPTPAPRTRRPLTEEEKEQRRLKRAENEERRRKEAEEEELRKAQKKRQTKQKLWAEHNYTSMNVSSGDETKASDEDETEVETSGDEEDEGGQGLRYVSGDVTQPHDCGERDAVVVHCVDDSGEWGSGGLFTALSNRSQEPQTKYETAGKMKDLVLGDVHLIPIDDRQSRDRGNDLVALVVCQHRDRRGEITGIKLSSLSTGLQKISKVARRKKASVHLPRIGFNTPGFNWYATERLIRKYLASRGIATSIYYYPRRKQVKRKASLSDDDGDIGMKRHHDDDASQDNEPSTSNSDVTYSAMSTTKGNLPSFFDGVRIYFHKVNDSQKWTRYVIAYNGDVHTCVEDDTTHVITDSSQGLQELSYHGDVEVVSLGWLKACLGRSKLVKCTKYYLH